jgi:hypothetical protein
MKTAHLFAAVAALSLATGAQAYTINILPAPDNLVAFSDGCNGGSCVGKSGTVDVSGLGTFTGDVTVYPADTSIGGIATAPLLNGEAYAAVGNAKGQGGGSAELATVGGPYKALDLEWGSIDLYNSIVIDPDHGAPITITGAEIGALIPGVVYGDTSAFVQILGLPAYKDVSFISTGENAFEFQFSGVPCPELSTWAMFAIGFACLGFAAFRQRLTNVSRSAVND